MLEPQHLGMFADMVEALVGYPDRTTLKVGYDLHSYDPNELQLILAGRAA
jgi:hypothetical protein